LTRLLDLGLDRLQTIIMDMAKLSEQSVFTSIEAYDNGVNHKRQIHDWSEKLRSLQEETGDLAIESIARFQPVATDLRFIRSCMELAYSFSRFGRYAYDIVDVLETIGPTPACDKTAVLEMAKIVREMILLSKSLLETRDKAATSKLYQMDDTVDTLYRKYLREVITEQQNYKNRNCTDARCYISALLILRFLERISDHACYVGDSVHYISTGSSSPRR
jgi:phosphate transport system protein